MPSSPGGGKNPFSEKVTPLVTLGLALWAARNETKTTHNLLLERSIHRDIGLNNRSLTTRQYVTNCAKDYVAPKKIEEGLLAWGGTENGVDFSNPDNFNVRGVKSNSPVDKLFGRGTASCYLNVKKDNSNPPVGSAEKGAEGPSVGSLRGGGVGDNPIPELRKVTEDVTHMTERNNRYQPNPSCDISEKDDTFVEGIDPNFDTFRVDTVQPVNQIWFYVIGISLSFILYFLFEYLKAKFPKWAGIKDSSQSASAELMFQVLESHKKGTITEKGATRILMTYYNLSKAEALECLNEE
jgi:hypothetical protein